MATVADISGNGGGGALGSGPENALDNSTQVVAAVHGTLVPSFVGQIATDETNNENWRSIGLTTTSWVRDYS